MLITYTLKKSFYSYNHTLAAQYIYHMNMLFRDNHCQCDKLPGLSFLSDEVTGKESVDLAIIFSKFKENPYI
jgi:hypothetical protein